MLMLITIDGPSASGKTSLANSLGEVLNMPVLDSGIIYRLLACVANDYIKQDIIKNPHDILKHLDFIVVKSQIENNKIVFFVQDMDTCDIKSEKIAKIASDISVISKVRTYVNNLQLQFKNSDIIAIGRDAGSVVFPDADFKIFLDADVHERAKRRYKELSTTDSNIMYDDILSKILSRDSSDTSREEAKLIIPDGAFVINNTELSIEQTVNEVIKEMKENGLI